MLEWVCSLCTWENWVVLVVIARCTKLQRNCMDNELDWDFLWLLDARDLDFSHQRDKEADYFWLKVCLDIIWKFHFFHSLEFQLKTCEFPFNYFFRKCGFFGRTKVITKLYCKFVATGIGFRVLQIKSNLVEFGLNMNRVLGLFFEVPTNMSKFAFHYY